MAASSNKDQLSLPPMPLRGSEQADPSLRNSQQDEAALRRSEQLAAEALDAAFFEAHLENKDIAFLCGVSVSLVEKWRTADQRGCPSLVQMLLLPPAFHCALHRQLNKRFGFGRAALVRLLDAVGDLALVVNE